MDVAVDHGPIIRLALAVAKDRAEAALARELGHEPADRDVGRREPAVPEEDALVVALAARLPPHDDLGELGLERLLA
jgi:hypothetical protein